MAAIPNSETRKKPNLLSIDTGKKDDPPINELINAFFGNGIVKYIAHDVSKKLASKKVIDFDVTKVIDFDVTGKESTRSKKIQSHEIILNDEPYEIFKNSQLYLHTD
jgi:hypothetical protein